jgi:hypothetical protein
VHGGQRLGRKTERREDAYDGGGLLEKGDDLHQPVTARTDHDINQREPFGPHAKTRFINAAQPRASTPQPTSPSSARSTTRGMTWPRRPPTTTRALRSIEAEGTSDQQLLRDTRELLARHSLEKTTLLAAGEIYILLGFDEPNLFFRAFRA